MNGSAPRIALDNLLRRELKVSNPNDASQVAQALLAKYKDTPRAAAIAREAEGVPFLLSTPAAPPMLQAATSSDAEMQQAIDDVERDLQELTTNTILKDVTPELQGWATAIRSAIAEGKTAARFALDPRQRDKAFGVRRTLGDYARLARLIGALTPSVSINYRKLAQSLDEVAAVLLVVMGESLANVGFSGGRFLLQVPFSELQVRRDAAIYALRNLMGATQEAYGPNEWPRGLDAYRKLFNVLETQGQGDLRTLLVENELARTMDELIQRAAHGSAEGLRALGATAQLDLERIRRLVIMGQRVVNPESPPLTAFLEALLLFADAFETAGGFRLLHIARPPVLFYGLYGTSGIGSNSAERRLLDLIIQRGVLAEQLDCFMQCACTQPLVICQIVLDKLLYDLDRAIDLYALGSKNFGKPERRASVYSFLIQAFLDTVANVFGVAGIPTSLVPIQDTLISIQKHLRPLISRENALAANLLTFSGNVLTQLKLLPSSQNPARDQLIGVITTLQGNPEQNQPVDVVSLFGSAQQGEALLIANSPANIPQNTLAQIQISKPRSLTALFNILKQELCIYRDMEDRWEGMVRTLAPNCVSSSELFEAITQVIDQALLLIGSDELEERCFEISLPPPYETILGSLAYDTGTVGEGRDDDGDQP